MSDMKTFYTLVSSTDRSPDSYLEALIALTAMPLDTLISLVGDLGWQEWGEQDRHDLTD